MSVRFDDRLKTAMTQPVVDEHDRIVRWRQMVDLLARLPEDHDEALADAGFALVEREAAVVPEATRASMARNIAGYPVDVRMVAMFARDSLGVAAPLLASANLSASEWAMIDRDCSPQVATFIATLVRGAETAQAPTPSYVAEIENPFETPASDDTPSISQMVARIEQLRMRRASGDVEARKNETRTPAAPEWVEEARHSDKTEAPVDEALFRWESDASGQIAWVDGAPRGALVGAPLPSQVDGSGARAMQAREPFDGAHATFSAPSVAGEWRLSGIPAFSPVDGRFLGYRGLARRNGETAASHRPPTISKPVAAKPRDLDTLRETIHEIKTPLNAIIGFAEIIDGQYLGPAHRNYRQRAAGIVAQARTLLGAIQDLDLAVRLQVAAPNAMCRLDDVVSSVVEALVPAAQRRGVSFHVKPSGEAATVRADAELADALLRRFLAAFVEVASTGDRFELALERVDSVWSVRIPRPSISDGLAEDQLLGEVEGEASANDSVLGFGFALRLVRGLVRLVDGNLSIGGSDIVLSLPRA